MSEEIVNKVALSPLITFNLEDFLPKHWVSLDLGLLLEDGFLLREKKFRASVKELDVNPFKGKIVRLHCSTDAILPAWAALLVASKLQEHGVESIWANDLTAFFSLYFRQTLAHHDWNAYEGRPVIVKGCGDPNVPQDAYVFATQKLKAVAKKLSYGEACSAVPLKA